MKSFNKILICFALGLLIQGGLYYYLDRIYLAPTTDVSVLEESQQQKDDNGQFPEVGDGRKYYSHEKKYMAVVKQDSVRIYSSGKSEAVTIDLKGRSVSFFEWMPDRDLAIMALYGGRNGDVILAQFNPENPDHEVDTTIEDLPSDSRIVDVAYSTATNVVYMKVRVDENAYRIYRTDANYDTRRIYVQATNIGRIAVFYDEDEFFYDNVRTGDIYVYNGTEGSWRVINPSGRYRLVGVDTNKDIYIANVNSRDEVLSVSRGQLGVGFKRIYSFASPVQLSTVTISSVKQLIEQNGEAGSTGSNDDQDSSSSSERRTR